MRPEKPDWQRLCEDAANEDDPKKLTELMTKISRDIKEKEARLRQPYQPFIGPRSDLRRLDVTTIQ